MYIGGNIFGITYLHFHTRVIYIISWNVSLIFILSCNYMILKCIYIYIYNINLI